LVTTLQDVLSKRKLTKIPLVVSRSLGANLQAI
jgi:hypothetical protein